MNLPENPYILVSVLNTKLRDEYSSLEKLCDDYDVSMENIILQMTFIGYYYNEEQNQFIMR